jgi:hypothetical protein
MVKPSGKGSHAGENAGSKWATPEEMAELPLHPDFRATAEKLGMPRGGGTKAPASPPSMKPRHPLVRDDYKAGRRVTWRYQGEQKEGTVQGPHGQVAKGKWPDSYDVKTDNGDVHDVKWAALRLHPSENPKDAAKAVAWEKSQASGGYKTAPAAKQGLVSVASATTPGMKYSIPAKLGTKAVPVVALWESQNGKDPWIAELADGTAARPGWGGWKAAQVPTGAKWTRIPVTDVNEPAATSPLGRVVEAAAQGS